MTDEIIAFKGEAMTPEERAAIAYKKWLDDGGFFPILTDVIRQAILEEREACALHCEDFYTIEGIAQKCAKAIRDRK